MGIYYMDVRNVSKAKQSAVAKAAYVSGERLRSERDGESKFYKREEKPISFILKPDHAPEWVFDRERLWNEAEKVEKAVNSRVAREVVVALPIELNKDIHKEIVQEYVQKNFVEKGMVADCNIHYDKEQNPHAHILLTVRPFDEKGNWSAKSKREYLKDEDGNFLFDENNKKKFIPIDLTKGWNDKKSVLEWRKSLADIINQKYKEHGLNIEISHLSNEDLGLNKIANKRLERTEYEIEIKHKEYCEKNNIPYEPKTTFGKINAELQKSQNKINEYDKEIKKLEIEKLSITFDDKNVLGKIINIKKENYDNLSPTLLNNYSIVAKRLNISVEEINLNQIQKLDVILNNWERKISQREANVKGSFNLIDLMDKDYKENVNLKKYGIENNDYPSYRNMLLEKLKKDTFLYSEEMNDWRKLKNVLDSVEKNEYKIMFKQFVMIYPEYKDIAKFQTKENAEKMFKALNQFANNLVKEKLQQFEHENLKSADVQQLRNSIRNNLDKAKYTIPQYFALNKLVKELETKINNKDELGLRDTEIQKITLEYFGAKANFEKVKSQYKETMETMNDHLSELYKTDMSKLSPKLKQELLKNYLDENEIKSHKDLQQNINREVQENKMPIQSANSILDALIVSSMEQGTNNNKYDEENKWKKKNGFEKGK